MSLSRFCTSLAVLGTVLFAPPLRAQTTPPHPPIAPETPRLNDAAELARVVSLYEAGKYGECADSLKRLLSGESAHPFQELDVIENARVYHAACLIGSGQNQQADASMSSARPWAMACTTYSSCSTGRALARWP